MGNASDCNECGNHGKTGNGCDHCGRYDRRPEDARNYERLMFQWELNEKAAKERLKLSS